MRFKIAPSMLVVATAFLLAGCAGPEEKFGRGLTNLTEFTRLGEWSRSYEQAALFDGPDSASTGMVRGFNSSLKRTLYGAYEIVTFPVPNHKNNDYGPILKPVHPLYPASYKPGMPDAPMLNTDYAVGFSSGEVVPFIPGSRFRIFEP